MPETRIIKRYANRKLYDTLRSRYVTLDQIAEMIRTGEDVQIVDNSTKEDLTSITLTQIIFEEEKKKSFLPLSALRNIIQSSNESIHQIATQAGEKVRAVFRREKEDGEGGVEVEAEAGSEAQAEEAKEHKVREFFERSQHTFDEWQKRVDDRIRAAMESLSPLASLEKEIRNVANRVADLEKKLDER